MQKKDRTTDDATTTFVGLVDEIRELAQAITEAADNHFDSDPDEIDWGWVGDATWTRDRLAEIVARIRGEQE